MIITPKIKKENNVIKLLKLKRKKMDQKKQKLIIKFNGNLINPDIPISD